MYYPSFFAGVRPFETLRDRVDNPLDLSVKQTVSRPEGPCLPEHEDMQLLMERKLAATGGLSSQPLTQQMPLLDNMFSYKPFGTDSMSCQLRGPSSLLGPNIGSPYCTTSPSGHPMSHLALVPDILHQNNNPLTMDATTPSLSSFAISASGLPYHMRIGSAATAAAVMANQRAYFGHSSVMTPHMSGPYGASMPHILYNDLMSDMVRRPVEPETNVFGTLSSLRTPPDSTTHFSEHLQRLRGQHIQQNKCSAPCCQPSLHTSANHGSNSCNCCDVGLVLPSPHSVPVSVPLSVPVSVSMPCNDVCNRDTKSNKPNHSRSDISSKNNNNENKNSFKDSLFNSSSLKQKDLEVKSLNERQSSQEGDNECVSCFVPNLHLWNPSQCNKQVVEAIDCHNNHSDKSGPNSNDRNDRQKQSLSLNSCVSDKRETGFSKNNTHEVITLDEKSNESQTQNVCNEEHSQKCQTSDRKTNSDINLSLPRSDSIHISTNSRDVSSSVEQMSTRFSNQTNEELNLNSSNVSNLEITSQISNGIPNQKLSHIQLKPELNEKVLDLKAAVDPPLNTQNSEAISFEPYFKQNQGFNTHKSELQTKVTTGALTVKNLTKQLKDYKPVTKHLNVTSFDKNKRQTKETKTVEVQCDGPDWTPIMLPAQLKNKLQKAVRNKLFGNDCKKLSSIRFNHKKDSKKRKRCKQKHSHSIKRSRSSSVSSRKSSSEREWDSMSSTSANKSRKRSMLQCLVNSDGYVADKPKKADRQPNLIASDPSQLGREERALQRAIKHIEDLNKPYVRDNCVKNEEVLNSTENNKQIDENHCNESTGAFKEGYISRQICESYERIIESVVDESRLQTEFSDEEPSHILDGSVGFKTKKKKVEQNKNCGNKVIKINESTAQTNATKQKKGIVSVRRRRFRSGLDMIRSAHRRKKPRNNKIQNSNRSHEPNRPSTSKTCELMNCEPTNGSVPTEMKRLMVNKALGETLLHRAARSNRLDVVNFCLQSNTYDVNARDNANYTPLHECSTRGNLQIARLLLQNGADVNSSAAGGIRPIHDAIENNHIEVVRLLLSYGADPNISTYSGSTAIQLSRSKAMLKFLKGFLSDISNDSQTETVLSWKFNASSNILDTNQKGFDIFDGLPSDEVEEESHDFLFEVSDSPMEPTYRLPNLCSKGSDHFMRLSDVLNKIRLTREEFVKNHSDIEIVSLSRHELEEATVGQILTKFRALVVKKEGLTEDIVFLDDRLRNVIGIDTLKLR